MITKMQNQKSESEMLHHQEDNWLVVPAAPRCVLYFRIYVQALGVLWCVERAKRQERDEIWQDHRDHRRQELAAVAPQDEQRDLCNIHIFYIIYNILNQFQFQKPVWMGWTERQYGIQGVTEIKTHNRIILVPFYQPSYIREKKKSKSRLRFSPLRWQCTDSSRSRVALSSGLSAWRSETLTAWELSNTLARAPARWRTAVAALRMPATGSWARL